MIGSGYYIKRLDRFGSSYRVIYGSIVDSQPPKSGRRGDIVGMSEKSAIRVAFAATVLSPKLKSMVTFTLPSNGDIRPMKDALNAYLTARRTYHKRHGQEYAYVWFLEFTKRGWPHIHLLTSDTVDPQDKTNWERVVMAYYKHYWRRVCKPSKKLVRKSIWFNSAARNATIPDNQRVAQALRAKDGAARYAAKYAAKSSRTRNEKNYQKNPQSRKWTGRMWGASRLPSPEVVYSVRRDVGIEQLQYDSVAIIEMLKTIKPHLQDYGTLPSLIF